MYCHVMPCDISQIEKASFSTSNIVVCMKIIYKKNHKDIATYTQPKNPAWEIWRKHHRTTIQETRGSIFFNSFWGLQLGAPKMGYPKIPWFPFLKGTPPCLDKAQKSYLFTFISVLLLLLLLLKSTILIRESPFHGQLLS